MREESIQKTIYDLLLGAFMLIAVLIIWLIARQYAERPAVDFIFATGYACALFLRALSCTFVKIDSREPFYPIYCVLALGLLWRFPYIVLQIFLFAIFLGISGYKLFCAIIKINKLHQVVIQMQQQAQYAVNVQASMDAYTKLKKSYDDLFNLHAANQALYMNVSHDLRTPIAVIKGYLDLLIENQEAFSDEQKQYLERIDAKTQYLNRLIEDLFLLTSIEERRLTINKSILDLNMLIRSVVYDMSERAKEKNIQINLRLSDGQLDREVDETRFYQIIENILDNAIKFSGPDGEVRIETKSEPGGRAYICISDNGIGISEERLTKIFNSVPNGGTPTETEALRNGNTFTQEPSAFGSITKNFSVGTGLGLRICRELVLYHGGAIWAKSKMGTGTSIHIKI